MTNIEYAAQHPDEFARAMTKWLEDFCIFIGHDEFKEEWRLENSEMLLKYFNEEANEILV